MSFKDTFTRDSSGKENLQYDDVAFHHFFVTILLVVTLPLLYSIIKTILNPFGHLPRLKDIQQKRQFEQKVKKFKKDNRFSYITTGFVFKNILLILLIVGIGFSFFAILESSQQIKGFDPYEILGVQQDAPIEKIKKAYRKLALIYHPDRNRDNPQASAKFIMISKAYQCLTNEQAKQKCLKYGNPEGSNSFNVGIALPSFLIKKQNHVVIMGFIFLIVVIILPAFVIHYHSEMNKYDDFGMLSQNQKFIHGFLNQHYSIKDCVKTFAISYEFKQLRNTKNQIPKLEAMLKSADEDILNYIKKKNLIPYMKKPMLLISSRINGLPQKNDRGQPKIAKQLQDDYRFILKKIPILVKATIMIAVGRSVQMVQKQQHFVGFNALKSLILFGQYFIQGKSYANDSQSFQQLPLTQDQIERIRKKKKNKKLNDIRQLIYSSEDKQALIALLQERRQSFIKQCIQYFPTIQMRAIVKSQEDHQIAVFDAFKVNIQVESNRTSNFCSTNTYPFLKMQGWYLIATNGNAVVFIEHFNFNQKKKQFKFDYRQDKPGAHSLAIYLFSDCYYGLDVELNLKYDVKPPRKHIEQQHDKHDHQEQQSFFSKMMQSIIPSQQEQVSDKEDNDQPQKKEVENKD